MSASQYSVNTNCLDGREIDMKVDANIRGSGNVAMSTLGAGVAVLFSRQQDSSKNSAAFYQRHKGK